MTTTILGNYAFADFQQAASPANPCRNKPFSSNIMCENKASQVDGNANVVKLKASGADR
jgi:hypothetical protein